VSRRAFFGLGSNLGDRWAYLQSGIDGLRAIGNRTFVSRIYETAPVGGPDGQGAYLNCVVALESDRAPLELLAVANGLEDAAGRVRLERFGPRTLDVDILMIEGVTSGDPNLTLPHPRMLERAFVLAPLEELDAAIPPAGWRARLGGEHVVSLAARPVGVMLHVSADQRGPVRAR
jgi:2-amino-4-hydroxy-6-hydroxymethyldihydropteridine diphosphokinase